ncbi:MAG: cyclic nucleotide-binding domain-containing protein [Desulfobacteraceae bacterium]|jgi:CRP-like cAMP-binding protein
MDRSEIQHVLESCEFFRELEKSDIQKIAGLCHAEAYDPGQYVFRQGDFGDRIYVIAEGQVSLERAMDLGTRPGSAVIAILGKGRVLGCWSTLLNEPHNLMSSACCQKPSTVISMKGAELRAMMVSDKFLGFSVLEKLCFLLRDRIQSAYGAMEKI